MVNDVVLDSSGGLIAANNKYASTEGVTDWGVGQQISNTDVFPAGLTIYGRWTEIDIASGKLIAYLGT